MITWKTQLRQDSAPDSETSPEVFTVGVCTWAGGWGSQLSLKVVEILPTWLIASGAPGKFLLRQPAWPPAPAPGGHESPLQPVLDLSDLVDKGDAHGNLNDARCLYLGKWTSPRVTLTLTGLRNSLTYEHLHYQ